LFSPYFDKDGNHLGNDELYNYSWSALFLIDKETKKGFAKETFYNDFINRAKEYQRLRNERLEPLPYH